MKRLFPVFISMVFLSACSSNDSPDDPAVSTSTSTTQQITVPDTTVPDTTTSTTLPENNLPSDSDKVVSVKESARVGLWEIEVLNVNLNATQTVMETNQFNEPPGDGQQFVLAEVLLTYNGENPSVAADLTYHAIGSNGTLYDEFDAACGVIPSPLDQFKELAVGEEITGQLCWSVASEHVEGLMLVISPVFNETDSRAFFSLTPLPTEPVQTDESTPPVTVAE